MTPDVVVNVEAMRLWVEALRSGKFEQGIGYLQGPDGRFCCLGVLCEVAIAAGVNVPKEEAGAMLYGVDEHQDILPYEVMQWTGTSHNPWLKDEAGREWSATTLNDSEQLPFLEIANFVERTFLPPVPVAE